MSTKISVYRWLGLRDLVEWNKAGVIHHIHVLVVKDGSLWVRWTNEYVLKGSRRGLEGDPSEAREGPLGEVGLVSIAGSQVWTSKTKQLSVAFAVLRNDGNLVLLNEKKDVIWQSFDNLTDTLLPVQRLSTFRTLRAASQNYVSSLYSLYMNVSGQLQMRWESSITYWSTERLSNLNLSAVVTSDGSLQLEALIQVWQAVENQCNVFATCYQQGICVFNESGTRVCTCPFHHTMQSNLKCLVSSQHDCNSGSVMIEHANMFLYGIYPVHDFISLTSLDKCKNLCLSDPSCTAVTFTNDGSVKCRMMRTRYGSGYSDPFLSATSFVKRCSDPLATDPIFPMKSPPHAHKESYSICIPCLVGVASGTIFVFILIQLGMGFYLYKRRNSYRRLASLAYLSPTSKCLIMLSFTEIRELTGNFSEQLEPKVFKGALLDKQPVAVKELEARKFRAAVSKVRSIYHKGLVKLEGYCCEFDHREFLCHGNLKCENVLLNENFEAKVNEFGLGMFYGEASSHRASAQKDVEDFGKMVLTLVSGVKEVDDVLDWAYKE
ncbi:Detected protein of unknown function [Hibiscus syriacus]|uniref:Apple domain-containing protein n=1 Tax=Hibiscus syriacus TaxID=106335 RepID=A0A6A2WM46_HIBSY|nr:Detected protein of unknown function [Hibiscus syriacus]